MKCPIKKLSEVAFINPRKPQFDRDDATSTSFIPMENVDGTNGIVEKLVGRPYVEVKKGYTYFEEEDVIFAKITPCMQNGKHAVVRGLIDGIGFGSTEFHVIRCSDKIIPDWVYFYLRRKETLDAAEKTFTGAVGQQRVPTTFFENLNIPVPSIQVQRRIAARLKSQLTEVGTARKAAEAQLVDADALSAAYLREVFEGKHTERWPSIPLGDAGEVVSGITLGRKTNDERLRNVPYLRVANVKDGRLDLSEIKTIEATEREIDKWRLLAGDILLTEGGDPDKLGRGTFWSDEIPECIHQNHIFRVRFPADKYLPEFVSAQIGSSYGKAYFLAHAKKTTGIATINQKVLKAFPVFSPPLEKQKEVMYFLSEKLEQTNKIVAGIRNRLDEINILPNRLLSQAFEIN